jgi:rhodanese-related sulfurtransferase
MRLISAQELKEKLDRGDPLKLVNALGDWEYRAEHIPGSLHFSSPEEMLRGLGRDDEIVVHCSTPSCMASVALYQLLERNGYRNFDASLAACRRGGGRVSAGRGDGGWARDLRRPDGRPRRPQPPPRRPLAGAGRGLVLQGRGRLRPRHPRPSTQVVSRAPQPLVERAPVPGRTRPDHSSNPAPKALQMV